ncbi:MAG: glucose 1-dehydrogenase [Acidobacteriaceae bacterium]|nr:glucose 1-dehydrogenase [Acidobacteriaceae bacterium]
MVNPFRLDNKVAIVTGASRGIGQAAAVALAEAGARVAVLGNSQMPEDTRKQIADLGAPVLAFQGDLTDRAFRDRVVNEVLAVWGSVDILVNNAGTTVRTPAVDFAEKDWDRVIDVNLTSVFRMCQRCGREMIKRGSGKIINIASVQSFTGGFTIPAYAASKGGIAQVTKALANEWASLNVNVNAIAPGYILTDLTRPIYDDPVRSKEILDRIPVKRWGTPDDMKGTVVYLASRASDFVHGHILLVDGGWMAR